MKIPLSPVHSAGNSDDDRTVRIDLGDASIALFPLDEQETNFIRIFFDTSFDRYASYVIGDRDLITETLSEDFNDRPIPILRFPVEEKSLLVEWGFGEIVKRIG
ncbi:hypothetical protein OpiT1DRAFT_05657 [Opitutaceae bacterium TAV1]|nr:hypothetical protein OpiT1DRAFT_05657 [Opitutaceae bacterium TAV1]